MLLNELSQNQLFIKTEINYIKPNVNTVFDLSTSEKSANQLTDQVDTQLVDITNARLLNQSPSLNNDGFGLVRNNYSVSNYFDDDSIRVQLYPQLVEHLINLTGASQGLVFDHTIRSVEDSVDRVEKRSPINTVHNDYVSNSAEKRLHIELTKKGLKSSDFNKYQFINTWIPLVDVVLDSPLALGDAQTFSLEQSQQLKVVYPDRMGEIEGFSFSKSNRWFYFPQMTSEEQLNFKVFDSDPNTAINRVPHSAFTLPMPDKNAPKRVSIELRAILLFN
jgi:hypothetical protein